MPSAADLQTDLANARTHILAGEYDDALVDLAAAEVALSGLPNTEWANWQQQIDRAYALVEKLRAENDSSHRPRRLLLRRPR